MKTAEGLGAWHNNYNDLPIEKCVERAVRAKLGFVIVKYGYPDVEQAYVKAGIPWATERFVLMDQLELEGNMLADAVDAGACFAVVNAEEGGGWGPKAGTGWAMTKLIDTFRFRHPHVALYACLDTRGDRLYHPYQQVALDRCDAILPMVYPVAFYPHRPPDYISQAFRDTIRGKDFQGQPIFPVLQSYGKLLGPGGIKEQFSRAMVWGKGCSFYTIHHATDAEWDAVCALRPKEQPEQTGAGKLVLELAHRIEVIKLAADGDWTGLHKELDKRGH